MIHLSIHKKLNTAPNGLQLKINATIEKGELITLYGVSGSGKTSLLRIISGLAEADSGKVTCNGNTWYDSTNGINTPPQQRGVGFVFQDYALFPNMTALENLHFALRKKQDPAIIEELLQTMELEQFRNHKPHQLSGGQQQRLALARALVQQPKILLLDEPLSAIDVEMRRKLQNYILQVHKKYNLTTLLVSHDIGEICKLSDRVLVLKNGRIEQSGRPFDIFSSHSLSGKFQFTGELIEISKESVVYILTVLIGNNLVKVIADEKEAKELTIGDKVMVASKAFNPVVKKIN